MNNLNLVRKNTKHTKQVSLNKRLIEIIASNDIPQLSILIKVCVNNGMGVQSIIGRLNDAIRGKYHANYTEMEKNVATLVYRIGGPRLLHIMHVSHGLPGVSTTHQFFRKKMQFFSAGVDESFDSRIKHNTAGIVQAEHNLHLIKMDEIATEVRNRWNNADNKIYGLCYEHSYEHSMKFDTMDDITRISGLIEAGTCHTTKENLVVAVGENGNNGQIQPFLSLPTCSKTESLQFVKMMESIFSNLKCDIVATDGDAMQRKTFSKMSKPVTNPAIKDKLKALLLFDCNIINGDKALYFDDKHCAKRFRGVIISETRGCKIDGVIIARDQLEFVFKKAGLTSFKSALNPANRQNVPAVLKL